CRDAGVEEVEVGVGGAGHTDERVKRATTHGGHVAHVDGQRLPPQVVQAHQRQVCVHTLDHEVGRQQEGTAGRGGHGGGVVADPGLMARGCRKDAADALDGRPLTGSYIVHRPSVRRSNVQGVIKTYDPGSRTGVVVRDTDRSEYDLADNALEG